MELHISILAEKLGYYNPNVYLTNEEIAVIKNVKHLDKNQIEILPNTLYICDAHCLDFEHFSHGNLLVITESPILESQISKGLNIILISNNNVFPIFNKVLEIFSEYQKFNDYTSKLLDLLSSGEDIQYLIDSASEMIGNPIFVRDENFKIIALTQNVELDDYIWNKIVTKRYQTEKDFNYLTRNGFLQITNKKKSPVYFKILNHATGPSETEPEYRDIMKTGLEQSLKYIVKPYFDPNNKVSIPRIWSNIFVQKKIIGTVVVLEAFKKFSEVDIALIARLSEILSLHLQRDRYYENKIENKKELLLLDLLDERINDRETLEETIKLIGWKIKDTLQIITVTTDKDEISDYLTQYIRGYFQNHFNCQACLFYEGRMIVLLNYCDEKALKKEQFNTLYEFMQSSGFYIGVSRSFDNLLDFKKCYSQSLKAIESGRLLNEKKLFFYDDYLLQHMLQLCSGQISLKEFCHPSIFILMDYDRKRKTNYVKSLYSYISNFKNPTELAKSMNVHRNTLYYRIEKIEKIMNINLSNLDHIFSIYLSFKILEYLSEELV